MMPKKKTDRRRYTGTGADGVGAQNTRLEVRHKLKEIASRRACDINLRKWHVEGVHNRTI